jgi:hypothetical protein
MSRAFPLLLLAGCFGGRLDRPVYGDACGTETPCVEGLVCAQDATCRYEDEPGTFGEGDDCVSTAQCALGLACAGSGLCAEVGAAGTAAFGENCATDEDCRAGLSCADDGTCRGVEVPLWAGAVCPDPTLEDGPFRVFFEVPGDEPLSDFYRLPFPNDARLDDGVINLDGHPGPGPLIDLVGDAVAGVLRVASLDMGAYGNNQATFFRFSASPDLGTLTIGRPGVGSVTVVDVTLGAAEFNTEPPMRLQASTGRRAYLCHNWLAVHPLDGVPWLPGHTYAALVSRTVADEDGVSAAPDADFSALLLPTAPSEGRLQRAWAAYAPLRAWLTTTGADPASLAAAAVFTVQDPPAQVERVRGAVDGQSIPDLRDLILCGVDDDRYADPADPDRGCQGDGAAAWSELQGLVDLPAFQSGLPPYKDQGDGGAIGFERTELPVTRTDAVHVSVVLPSGAPPPDGWPVILYGHGTGGNYTSAVREGLADQLTEIALGDATVRFAIVSFDAPMHGPRAFPENWKSTWLEADPDAYEPDVLFFNPLNPRAARDNALQQVADLMGLTRMLANFDLAPELSPTGERIQFDPANLYYLGHSQGGVVGATFLAHTDLIRGAVLSGAGGLTIQSLLHKTEPHDLAAMLRVGLADPDIDRVHPLLNIAQQIAEPADGVNHARHVLRAPLGDDPRRHILQTYGVGDRFSPDETQFALARALGVDQVPGALTPLTNLDVITLPASGNHTSGTTAVVHLYEAQGRDAHFVLFDRPDTIAHVRSFFATAVVDPVPTVLPF